MRTKWFSFSSNNLFTAKMLLMKLRMVQLLLSVLVHVCVTVRHSEWGLGWGLGGLSSKGYSKRFSSVRISGS